MTSAYQKGRSYEYSIMRGYAKKGLYVIRSAGSHGLFDIVAFDNESIYFACCRKRRWSEREIQEVLNSVKDKIPPNSYITFFEKIDNKEYVYTYKDGKKL
jgi:Holliday junction resolvase